MKEATGSFKKGHPLRGVLKYIALGLLGGLTYLLLASGMTITRDLCQHCGQIQIKREAWVSFYPFDKRLVFSRNLNRVETGYSLFLGKRSGENHSWELWVKSERLLIYPRKVKREVNRDIYERLPISPLEDARLLSAFFAREEKIDPDFRKRLSKLISRARRRKDEAEWSRALREKYGGFLAELRMGQLVR